jgi:prepilin-type N-terminal cleavage/methylation domain-containing protein
MLTRQRPISSLLMLDERGFTLVELVVALVAGLVVLGALFSVLEVSLRHSTAVQDRVQANQLGRIAMTKIVDELHSACLSPGFTPVQPESAPNELRFVAAYGNEAVLANAYEHRIVFTKKEKMGTLTDYAYKSNGGSWPKFTFSSTATPSSGTLLASNISETESGGKGVPVFRYYKYASSSGSTEALPLNTINETPLTTPLTSTTAAEAASAQVGFHTEVNDRNTLNRGVDLSAQVTFSFSVPNSETPIHDAPCQ